MNRKAHQYLGLCAVLAFLSAGCAGKDIHPDLKEDKTVLVRQWTLPTHPAVETLSRGSEFSNPVLLENVLLFGNQSVGLVALYPGLMQVKWALPIKGGVISELQVAGDQVFFGGGDGFLYCVSVETGRVGWRYDLHNPVISRPTVSQNRVFVTTSDDTVYAFDSGTGKWLWHYRRRTSPPATILGASAPLVDGNEVLAGLSDGFLVSLSLPDGQLKWERKIHQGSKFTDVDAHPVLEGDKIYIPSYDGALYVLKRQGGAVVWRFDAGGSKQVVLDGDRIYLASSDGSVYALQKETSKVLWKFELDNGTPTQVVVTDRHVIVGSSYQYLYALDKDSGKGLYRYNVGYGSGFYGSPAYDAVHGRVYLLSGAGNLMAFSERAPNRKRRPFGAIDGYNWQ